MGVWLPALSQEFVWRVQRGVKEKGDFIIIIIIISSVKTRAPVAFVARKGVTARPATAC